MVRRLLPLILVPLAGCAFAPPTFAPATPVVVKTPVLHPVYCAAPPPQYPRLPISQLSGNSAPADTLRAYVASIIILKGVVRERDSVIAGCVDPARAATGNTSARADHNTQ